MDSNQNNPRISIQIGEEIQGDGEAYFKIYGAINSEGAEKQKQNLTQLCNELEVDKSLIIMLKSESSDASELKAYIEEILEGKEGLFKEFKKMNQDNKAVIKVHSNDDKVFIQVKPGDEFNEMIWGPFQMVLDSGLQDICLEQKNEFEFHVKSNKSFETLIEEFEKREQGIGANAFEQVAAKISLHLDKNLVESILGIVKNFDEELTQLPPLLMLQYFKNFALDLKFNSPQDLPADFKKHFLTPKKYYDDDPAAKEGKPIPPEFQKLIDLLGGEVSIFATIENTAAIKIEAKGQQLSKLAQKYGGLLKK